MNIQLCDHNFRTIRHEIQTITGVWPNQVITKRPMTIEDLESVLEDLFRAMFCNHMLHDSKVRGASYHVRYEDGSYEELEFINPHTPRGRQADARICPLRLIAA